VKNWRIGDQILRMDRFRQNLALNAAEGGLFQQIGGNRDLSLRFEMKNGG
jgi:hypothetical protein